MWEILRFLQKVAIVSDDLMSMGSLFQVLCTSTEKVHLPGSSIVAGTKSCCERYLCGDI